MNDLISATLIYDGSGTPVVPERLLPMEKAKKMLEKKGQSPNHEGILGRALGLVQDKEQMQGTPLEQLCELAGRACYDSLGTGRKSSEYHQHIREVGHTSVLAHANVTFEVYGMYSPQAAAFYWQRLPGTWVDALNDGIRVTMNLRTIADFCGPDSKAGVTWDDKDYLTCPMKSIMCYIGNKVAPEIIPCHREEGWPDVDRLGGSTALIYGITPEEKWVTMLLTGSRGFSHELVRHNYRCAISQRSTRYVDESGSPWVQHPLEYKWAQDVGDVMHPRLNVQGTAGEMYDHLVKVLQPWLIERGVDKFTARKQARGAARGYLGNALYTEVVFSASIAQWKRMLMQRATIHADAEIRECFCKVLAELKKSAHADYFSDWELEESPDGIGMVGVQKGP